ncbi:hypothetical protein [Streptomyces sp. NPDC058694]|uniref:hypothetical protein n=1 Tax=Streptomyces sp. NPDC058694 TaxID=3346603 RepID=UPI00365CBF20
MRHTITAIAAAALLALTACSSSSDDDKEQAPASTTPTNTPAPEQPKEDTAALKTAVEAYTAAYFKGDADTTYGMLSARCTEEITKPVMQALTDRAKDDYGQQGVKRFTVDQVSGDLARVSYGVGLPKFDQKQQPWAREGGDWKYDAC